jgi:putative DNA primase/helicase
MISLASTESGIPIKPNQLDADPWKLNANNGTIDLRTGRLGPHNQADYNTKIIDIDYDPAAQHELWDRFLREATGGDDDFAGFLQRSAGYWATGLTSEKRFFFIYSKKHDTGKSTFADAVRSALGEYAADCDFDTWLEQSSTGGNRGDLARLTGARLVISVEVRRRAKFDTKLMKAVTGGDPITCAAKYEKEFTFTPSFKILRISNTAALGRLSLELTVRRALGSALRCRPTRTEASTWGPCLYRLHVGHVDEHPLKRGALGVFRRLGEGRGRPGHGAR